MMAMMVIVGGTPSGSGIGIGNGSKTPMMLNKMDSIWPLPLELVEERQK